MSRLPSVCETDSVGRMNTQSRVRSSTVPAIDAAQLPNDSVAYAVVDMIPQTVD
jgi:hypothetical protein